MFKFETINNKKILKSDLLTKANGFFTTRESVITQRDLPELEPVCSQNRELIARYLKVNPEQLISPVQTHSANIAVAKEGQKYPDTDALVIIDTNIAIALNFADCTPVILYDSYNNIGAISHAGWRGTAAGIVPKTIEFMNKHYSTEPKNITAIIGPAISMDNYQVGDDVFIQIKSSLKHECAIIVLMIRLMYSFHTDVKTEKQHAIVLF